MSKNHQNHKIVKNVKKSSKIGYFLDSVVYIIELKLISSHFNRDLIKSTIYEFI